MEDEKKPEETPSRGNEWEVVSLTASAYAAAPGPEAFEPIDDDTGNQFSRDDEEVSRAMFMSGHFVFPPNEHENLPIEPIENEIDSKLGSENAGPDVSGLDMEEGDISDKTKDENRCIKGIEAAKEAHGDQFFDEYGNNLSGHDTQFGPGKTVENLVEEEKTIYSAHKFSSLLGQEDITESNVCDEDLVIPEPNVSAEFNPSSDSSKSLSPKKENKTKGSGRPCEAWWKRQAASFYAQAKEANAFWSVFVAAALLGIVIIGQRWQQERWQSLQSNINDELKASRMMGPLSRFKDVIAGGQRHGSVIRGSASTGR